ncbi:MAG: beta-ketoacyl synthase N-terminal-like domain-containing protein [Chloroflexota bacterium]|nr:beta-ketoacyl synthase N-terminal-like domain-containing protein [Chloroflexota bacterium]
MAKKKNKDLAKKPDGSQGVAIIGMSCMFPGARDLDTYWQNILGKVDSVTDPPPEAWDSEVFYDPESTANDRVYCRKGGFLGPLAQFNPLNYGIMPIGLDGGEPDQWLLLKLAYDALGDASYLERLEANSGERRRTAVILGKGTYLNRGNLNMVQHSLVVDQTLQVLQALHPEYGQEELDLVREALKERLPAFDAATAPGLVPNIAAGRIANRLDLMGPSYTVDAACASSLIAVEIAMRDLLTDHCDLALVGGAQVTTPIPILTLFSQLGALSRQEEIRPFDQKADGTILSEGIGMLVLKREEDAVRDDDRIYAVIKGVGSSSDGRAMSVLTPRVEGEILALQQAYEMAGVEPATVGLVEAHGTATLAGDASEIDALQAVFGGRRAREPQTALGTVKSMIGHTMPASGVAGIIKAALALYNKVLPPTIHCDEPNSRLGLEDSNFYLNTETRPWIQGRETPRRAGVNAFGFGGVNVHVILEEATPQGDTAWPNHMDHWESEVVVLAAKDRDRLLVSARELKETLEAVPDLQEPGFRLLDLAYTVNRRLGEQVCRLAIVATSIEDLRDKLGHAISRLEKAKTRKIKDVRGIYFFEKPFYPEGRVAFLFPGEGSQYPNMLADLCQHFPEVRSAFDRIDHIFEGHPRGYTPSDFIFPRPGQAERSGRAEQLWEIDGAVEAVLTANAAMHALLLRLDVEPDALVGHSTGEYSALLASGMIPVDEDEFVGHHLLNLNQMYEVVARDNEVPRAFMLAVGAGLDRVASQVEEAGGQVYVGMDNCPHQSVLVGEESALEGLTSSLGAEGLIFESLPFDRAYHTPLFEPYNHLFQDFYAQLPMEAAKVTTYSCVTAAPFGDDEADIRSLAIANWINRVRFRETIQAMYDDGIRIFVEVGARGNLTAFVGDILRGQSHLAVPANIQQRSGITQLNHLIGLLIAQGVPVDLTALYERREPRMLELTPDFAEKAGKQPAGTMKLASGWAGMEVSPEAAEEIRTRLAGKSVGGVVNPDAGPDPVEPVAASASKSQEEVNISNMQDNLPNNNGVQDSVPPTSGVVQPAQVYADGRALVMQGHLQLMDQFLKTQEALVQQFLTGSAAPIMTQSRPVLPLQPVALPQLEGFSPPPQPVQQQDAAAAGPEPAQRAVPPAPAQPSPPGVADQAPVIEASEEVNEPPDLEAILLDLVSDKTGYPLEVLSLDANLEADLGIDSIKRVEILGAFNQQTGLVEGDTMDQVSSLKTLGAILGFFQQTASLAPSVKPGWPSSQDAIAATELFDRMPFIRDVRRHVPGQELDALCRLDVSEDLFLRDHTLGREIARLDPDLLALPIVPLTVTMEILAEAAACLAPGEVLVEMRDLRAYRWILLEEGPTTLRVTAKRRSDSGGSEFDVVVCILPDGIATEEGMDSLAPAAEGTMIFAMAYPEPPDVSALSLQEERASLWQPDNLYRDGMFHGPLFRAVKSIDRVGSDGLVATMEALPTNQFIGSDRGPVFLAEPIILDAAGQLIGLWTLETLERGFTVFPYQLKALHFFGPALPPGEQVTCQVRGTFLDNLQMTSDIDIIDAEGNLRMRLNGWDDKRFDIPRQFYRFILNPGEVRLSEPWSAPLNGHAGGEEFESRRVAGFSQDFLKAHYHFWEKVLAHLVLARSERQVWREMGSDKRRIEWLLGRVAAKEAFAIFVYKLYNISLNIADIEISTDERGRPYVEGQWLSQIDRPISLSISHAGDVAAAVVGHVSPEGRMPGIGIDLEPVQRLETSFAGVAFTEQERSLLQELVESDDETWSLRLWCAKEAVGKALGVGLANGPHSVAIDRVDPDSGFVYMNLAGGLEEEFSDLSGENMAAYTTQENGFVVASVLG